MWDSNKPATPVPNGIVGTGTSVNVRQLAERVRRITGSRSLNLPRREGRPQRRSSPTTFAAPTSGSATSWTTTSTPAASAGVSSNWSRRQPQRGHGKTRRPRPRPNLAAKARDCVRRPRNSGQGCAEFCGSLLRRKVEEAGQARVRHWAHATATRPANNLRGITKEDSKGRPAQEAAVRPEQDLIRKRLGELGVTLEAARAGPPGASADRDDAVPDVAGSTAADDLPASQPAPAGPNVGACNLTQGTKSGQAPGDRRLPLLSYVTWPYFGHGYQGRTNERGWAPDQCPPSGRDP